MTINNLGKYKLPFILVVLLFCTTVLSAQVNNGNNSTNNSASISSNSQDTIQPLPYKFKNSQSGGLYLNNFSNLEVIFDPSTGTYMLYEKVGNYYIKHPTQMTSEEYQEYRLQRDMLEY